jgi:hypothetical protein
LNKWFTENQGPNFTDVNPTLTDTLILKSITNYGEKNPLVVVPLWREEVLNKTQNETAAHSYIVDFTEDTSVFFDDQSKYQKLKGELKEIKQFSDASEGERKNIALCEHIRDKCAGTILDTKEIGEILNQHVPVRTDSPSDASIFD